MLERLDFVSLPSWSESEIITWEASLARMKPSKSGLGKNQVWTDAVTDLTSVRKPFQKLPNLTCKNLCSKSGTLCKELPRELVMSLHPLSGQDLSADSFQQHV
jgi:hypothetical protein